MAVPREIRRRARNLAYAPVHGVSIVFVNAKGMPVDSDQRWDMHKSRVLQQHPIDRVVCPLADLSRYFVITTGDGEYYCHRADTLDEVARYITDDLDDEFPWFTEAVLDLDTGKSLSWKLGVTFTST